MDKASGLVKDLRTMLKDGLSPEEAQAAFKKFEGDSDLQRVRKEGYEKMQRDRDPLGVQRNELLGEIKTGINKLVEKNGGVPWSEG